MIHTTLAPLQGIIELLESDDFYCEVAVSSSVQGFCMRLLSQPATQELAKLIRVNPENAGLVLSYADGLARSISGSVRSDKDVALCACIVALAQMADPRVDDFLRYLSITKELALRWPSQVAEIVSKTRIGTVQTEMLWSSVSAATVVRSQAGETRQPSERQSSDFRTLSNVG